MFRYGSTPEYLDATLTSQGHSQAGCSIYFWGVFTRHCAATRASEARTLGRVINFNIKAFPDQPLVRVTLYITLKLRDKRVVRVTTLLSIFQTTRARNTSTFNLPEKLLVRVMYLYFQSSGQVTCASNRFWASHSCVQHFHLQSSGKATRASNKLIVRVTSHSCE